MRLRLTRQAERDLVAIWKWIARERPGIANDVLDRINRECRRLPGLPRLGRLRTEIAPDVRSLSVDRWIVLYRITHDVSRIVDGARKLERLAVPRS